MKRIIAFLLSVLLCISLCGCFPDSPMNKISHNEDASEVYYGGHTYILDPDFRYRTSITHDGWTEITWIPYGIFFILGAVTIFYGNVADNPEFITCSRTDDLYIREDIILDHNTQVCISDCSEPYSFAFSEIITGKVIEFDFEQKYTYTEVCNFYVTLEEYPLIEQWFEVWQIGGDLYIQDYGDSDFYEITDEFAEDLYRLGLDSFDYS